MGIKIPAVIVAFAGFSPLGPLCADPLSQWRAGDHGAAISAWERAARVGDAEANLLLAHIHRRGLGVAVDEEAAARWYRVAAEQGSPEAQYELALMYELGIGVDADLGEASHWYALATAQACPAELNVGGRLGDR